MIDAAQLARILAEQGVEIGADSVVVIVFSRDAEERTHARVAAKNASPLHIEGAASACLIALQAHEILGAGEAVKAQRERVDRALDALATTLGAHPIAPPTVIPHQHKGH